MKTMLLLVLLSAVVSCVTAAEDARIDEHGPDRAAFTSVSPLLEARCAMMDCHGATARNFRVYSGYGMRLSSTDRPSATAMTTVAEVAANYAERRTTRAERRGRAATMPISA